jgi:hypothetical protein
MKTVLITPDSGRTYALFRRQVLCFLVQARADCPDEALLQAGLTAALKNWKAQGYPRSWLVQAKADVQRALTIAKASAPARPVSERAVPG